MHADARGIGSTIKLAAWPETENDNAADYAALHRQALQVQLNADLCSLLTSQFTFDLLDAGQAGLQLFRQGFQQLVFGNTHGL